MRYILRYRGLRPSPGDELDQLAEQPGVDIIDRTGPRLALVEAPEEKIGGLRHLMPDWLVEQERESLLPDTWPDRRAMRPE